MELRDRFRGFAPVVVDVETGGFESARHALLELACVPLVMVDGQLQAATSWHCHVHPEPGLVCESEALAFTGIDPDHPFRQAVTEAEALAGLAKMLRSHLKATGCRRAILVGHNAHFDLGFVMAAAKRQQTTRLPLHSFSCFDTATLGGVLLGETVLAQLVQKAGFDFDGNEAHSALYDAQKTAELFCYLVNQSPFPLVPAGPLAAGTD